MDSSAGATPLLLWYIVGGLMLVSILLMLIFHYLYSKDPLGKLKKK